MASFLDIIACPQCSTNLILREPAELFCNSCQKIFPYSHGKAFFCEVNSDIQSAKDEVDASNPLGWTGWRKLNWDYCKKGFENIKKDQWCIDIGAGRGHFKELFKDHERYLACDFFPYKHVNVVCNFTQKFPIKNESVDYILLSNVLEHIEAPSFLLAECQRILKPGGLMIMIVPFLIKLHQEPYDFYRYTQYALKDLFNKAGFSVKDISMLGGICEIMEAFNSAIFKTFMSTGKYKTIVRRIEKRFWSLVNRMMLRRIRTTTNISKINQSHPQGYGCIAQKI